MAPYVVICEDGRIRHDGTFDSKAEAREFAEWGHCCTNRHRIRTASAVYGDERNN